MAPIAQSGPFGVQKCCFWPKTIFLWTAVQRIQQKNVVFLVSGHGGDKKNWTGTKKMDLGPKNCILTKNSAFFYATPMKPPFFWLGRSRLNGMTTPPYPEGTLDTFGFLVGGRLAARRAVSRPRLPKVALFGPKSGFFGQKSIFCPHPPISSLPS